MKYDIQLNESGTHHLIIDDTSMETIHSHQLFEHLTDSTGYINEDTLDRLKMHIRSLIASTTGNSKDLLDLCIDVIYHKKMKAYGLRNLIAAYQQYLQTQAQTFASSSDSV